GHVLQVLLAVLGDVAVLQFLEEATAALEAALLHVVLPAGLRVAVLERLLAAFGVQAKDLYAQRMPAANPVRLAVLDGLHVRAVPAAVAPGAVPWEIGGDEDRLARFGDD